ncbi:MAG: hypothetical protein ACE5JF_13345, partial [Anaerolineales bacterium]
WEPLPAKVDAQGVINSLYEGAGEYTVVKYPDKYTSVEEALQVLDCQLRVARFRALTVETLSTTPSSL